MNDDKMILRTLRPAALPGRESPRFLPKNISPADEPFTMAEVAAIARRRKWIILGCTAVGLMLALAASMLMTPKYESVSVIEINKENSDTLGLENTTAALSDGAD